MKARKIGRPKVDDPLSASIRIPVTPEFKERFRNAARRKGYRDMAKLGREFFELGLAHAQTGGHGDEG